MLRSASPSNKAYEHSLLTDYPKLPRSYGVSSSGFWEGVMFAQPLGQLRQAANRQCS